MKIKLSILLSLIVFSVTGQVSTKELLSPTGSFKIGTTVFEWVDSTRYLDKKTYGNLRRKIVAQLWYPTLNVEGLSKSKYANFSSAHQNIQTNSYLNAKLSVESKGAPLIIIVPGRGTPKYYYTTLIEDLASNGFIVLALDMPFIGSARYRNGLIIKPSSKFSPGKLMRGPYERVDEFFKEPTEIGFYDLQFAMRKLKWINLHDPNKRFNNKLDFKKIGIFGHSLGGRIAGEFTANNKNVKAYLAMEGLPPRDVRFEGKIKVPSAMLCSSATLPYAKENYASYLMNRSSEVYFFELLGFNHNSVIDKLYLLEELGHGLSNTEEHLTTARRLITSFFKNFLIKKVNHFEDEFKSFDNLKLTKYDKL